MMLLKSKFLSIAVPFLVLLIVQTSSCELTREAQLKEEGNKIIGKIEGFRQSHDRLPGSLLELGIKETEEGPIFYDKKSGTRYIVWFGAELGESFTYDSDTKKWRDF